MNDRLLTRLCSTLGMPAPIIQSAMGWVATPALVTASGNAGAFPFLAVATLTADDAERDIVRVRESLGDTPFGVNFLMEQPGAERIVDAVIRHGVRAAGYSRAPNERYIDRLKQHGVLCVATVGLPHHAVKAVELGADVVIAQGSEGGGHTGPLATSQLVPLVAAAVEVPVAAAGGFADGRGLVAALALGASGIAMGTRFLLTRESPVPQAVKVRYLAAGPDATLVTSRIDGLPQRVIVNDRVRSLEVSGIASRLAQGLRSARALSGHSRTQLLRSAIALTRARKSAVLHAANTAALARQALVDGDVDGGVLPAGQVVGRIDDLPTCAELVDRIVKEADAMISGVAT
jgi:NAD(P)H-dependent flavin oxidoreductase YrpB (nitropropane dioxygenase family)